MAERLERLTFNSEAHGSNPALTANCVVVNGKLDCFLPDGIGPCYVKFKIVVALSLKSINLNMNMKALFIHGVKSISLQ